VQVKTWLRQSTYKYLEKIKFITSLVFRHLNISLVATVTRFKGVNPELKECVLFLCESGTEV
jgi:hypothetical protein